MPGITTLSQQFQPMSYSRKACEVKMREIRLQVQVTPNKSHATMNFVGVQGAWHAVGFFFFFSRTTLVRHLLLMHHFLKTEHPKGRHTLWYTLLSHAECAFFFCCSHIPPNWSFVVCKLQLLHGNPRSSVLEREILPPPAFFFFLNEGKPTT